MYQDTSVQNVPSTAPHNFTGSDVFPPYVPQDWDAPLEVVIDRAPRERYSKMLKAAFPHDTANKPKWQRYEDCGRYFKLQKCENGHETKSHGSRCMCRTCEKCSAHAAAEMFHKYRVLAQRAFAHYSVVRVFCTTAEQCFEALARLRKLLPPDLKVPTLVKIGCPNGEWTVKCLYLAPLSKDKLLFLRSTFPSIAVYSMTKDHFLNDLELLCHADLPRANTRAIELEVAAHGRRLVAFWGLDQQGRRNQFVMNSEPNTNKSTMLHALHRVHIECCPMCSSRIVASTQTLTELTPTTKLKWRPHSHPNLDHLLPKDESVIPLQLNC